MCALLLLGGVPVAHAQISRGGTPYSFTHGVSGSVPTATMQPVDASALRAEDRAARQQAAAQQRPAPPPRFGKALDVQLGLENAGTWTDLPDGGRLWRLRIAAPGAHSINLIFDRFHLPPFAQLFIYNEDRSTVIGAFTSRNNKPYGKFSTAPVPGEAIVLEYVEPAVAGGERSYDEHGVYVYGYYSAPAGAATPTSDSRAVPDAFALQGSPPNPVRERAQIRYALPEASPVELVVYDVRGREVARPVDGNQPAGFHRASFDASALAGGVYVYRMRAGSAFRDTGTLVVVK